MLLLPVSFLVGWIDAALPEDPSAKSAILAIYALAAIAIIFCWVVADARKRERRASIGLRLALIVLTVAALPWYFFSSRGFLGGLKLAGLATAVFVGSMLCYRMGYSL